MNVLYGATGSATAVQREIDERREVVLTVTGWKRRIALRIIVLYAAHESHAPERSGMRAVYAGMAWRSFLLATLLGLCLHARPAGVSIKAYGKSECLAV